jgi:hypothetical protein
MSVNFQNISHSLEIRFTDDERGIDTKKIKKSLQVKNNQLPQMSEKEVAKLSGTISLQRSWSKST